MKAPAHAISPFSDVPVDLSWSKDGVSLAVAFANRVELLCAQRLDDLSGQPAWAIVIALQLPLCVKSENQAAVPRIRLLRSPEMATQLDSRTGVEHLLDVGKHRSRISGQHFLLFLSNRLWSGHSCLGRRDDRAVATASPSAAVPGFASR